VNGPPGINRAELPMADGKGVAFFRKRPLP